MSERASNRAPALTVSALLHVALLASALIVWPWSKPVKLSSVVPVTLVTEDEASAPSQAVAAPEPQTAQTEAPAPEAPPQAATPQPEPAPVPAPPPPKPVLAKAAPPPSPAKPAAKPTPTPAKPQAKAQESSFDPDAVLASLNKSAKAAGARQSSARRGPARPQTAVQARLTTGAGDAASSNALTSMAEALQRLWNPDCDVAGASDLNIRVTFRLSASGRLVGTPQSSGDSAPESSVLHVASDRAKRAVYAAEPFDNLPANLYGQPITVKFNGQAACGGGHGLG
ncbi:MAG TPA: energy transducer TonB [Caulobacteraceae bacterium]|jgi:outer membrane biosynthesis protein TonB|nr:energy transducer TonB [Caulobacteraceae bacterium]